jgi:hypothetical protein
MFSFRTAGTYSTLERAAAGAVAFRAELRSMNIVREIGVVGPDLKWRDVDEHGQVSQPTDPLQRGKA